MQGDERRENRRVILACQNDHYWITDATFEPYGGGHLVGFWIDCCPDCGAYRSHEGYYDLENIISAARQSGKTVMTALAMTPQPMRPIMYEMFEREGLVSSKPVRYAKFKS